MNDGRKKKWGSLGPRIQMSKVHFLKKNYHLTIMGNKIPPSDIRGTLLAFVIFTSNSESCMQGTH